MKLSPAILVRGVSWTVAVYAAGQCFRFVSNVILTRLLAPELFGIITVVHSARIGIELISDVGIGQNMVYNKEAEKPEFYNTAWSLQLIRGILLWAISLIAAVPLAHFYKSVNLAYLLPVASLPFIFIGLSSTGRYLAQKRMQFVRLNVFELILEFISAAVNIVAAYVNPTIWALIFGGVIASIARMFGSYFLVPGTSHKFYISKEYAWHIFHFSKWIFVSSLAFFLSMNFDSLYLGKAGTFALLGVYGIARALSQQVVALVTRLNATFVFPIIASSNEHHRDELRKKVAPIRAIFLLVTAAALSFIAVASDLLVAALYDQRYQAAGWMLPIFIVGAWFSILSNVNESILLGLGKPSYGAIASCVKFGWILIGVPFGYQQYGALGVVVVVAISDNFRYIPILVGQVRERLSFASQDLFITAAAIGMVLIWALLRWTIGFGIPRI